MRGKKLQTRNKKLEKTMFKFETPKIIGILSDKTVPSNLQRRINGILKRRGRICLPFRVETRYLKNVVACMRLMDIEGLIIFGNHTRRICRFIQHFDKPAKKAGKVNVILRRKNRFFGYYIEESQKIPFWVSKKR